MRHNEKIVINNNMYITVNVSVLGYCKAALEQSSKNNINAIKSLYEFYAATVKYNTKPTAPDEDFN